MPFPTIATDPTLGLTTSTEASTGQAVVDVRESGRGLPFLTPEENLPIDDVHRMNHVIAKVGSDLAAIRLASLIGVEPFVLMGESLR